MQGRASEEEALLDMSHSGLRRVFRRLKPDKEGRVAFSEIEKFAWTARLCPVRCRQDMVSGVELKSLCERTRTPNALITVSFAQFEQLLIRISKRMKGENRLRRVLEAIQATVVRTFETKIQKLSSLSFTFDDSKPEDQLTKRIPASRWSERSPPIDTPRPTAVQDSILTARSAGFSPIRIDRKPLFGLPTLYQASEKLSKSPTNLLKQVSNLVEGLRRQQESWHTGRSPNTKTQVRRLEEFALRTRGSYFHPAFVRRLVFGAWKNAVAT
jgi:hypothetical protein